MANEKKYANGVFGNVRTFQDGGEIYAIDIVDVEGFKQFLDENKGSDGKVRLDVSKQRNNPEKLSVSLNTYQPKG